MTTDQLAALDAAAKAASTDETTIAAYYDFARFALDLYRTGQLVVAPSVESVAFTIWHQLGQVEENVRAGALTQDEVKDIATAILASMGAKTDG